MNELLIALFLSLSPMIDTATLSAHNDYYAAEIGRERGEHTWYNWKVKSSWVLKDYGEGKYGIKFNWTHKEPNYDREAVELTWSPRVWVTVGSGISATQLAEPALSSSITAKIKQAKASLSTNWKGGLELQGKVIMPVRDRLSVQFKGDYLKDKSNSTYKVEVGLSWKVILPILISAN